MQILKFLFEKKYNILLTIKLQNTSSIHYTNVHAYVSLNQKSQLGTILNRSKM